MKKLIVSAIAILFLLCLSPTVMAGGTPDPNTSVQPANGIESDGGSWDDPDQITPQDFEADDAILTITKSVDGKNNIFSRVISFLVFPNISTQQPSKELNRHEKNIRRISAKRR